MATNVLLSSVGGERIYLLLAWAVYIGIKIPCRFQSAGEVIQRWEHTCGSDCTTCIIQKCYYGALVESFASSTPCQTSPKIEFCIVAIHIIHSNIYVNYFVSV